MTDRELLEAAARAAGVYLTIDWLGHPKYRPDWNPLTDSGQALELAVALRMMVNGIGKAIMDGVHVQTETGVFMEYVAPNGDPLAATRRCIVRAAASLSPKDAPHG